MDLNPLPQRHDNSHQSIRCRFSCASERLRGPRRFTLGVLIASVLWAAAGMAQTVNIWLTTVDQSSKLAPQSAVTFTNGIQGNNPVLVDETELYQEIEGFGASFTDSAAYLLNQVATPSARTNAMKSLFTREEGGIGLSFVRNPMGASDLARFHYSYDDDPPGGIDPSLIHFSIGHDHADIIPLMKYAFQLNPQLKVMASPWSPPGWMKDSGSMIGGSLLTSMYTAYANYFVKYIQAYEAAGIPVHYISLQNEPLYVPGDYPGMGMEAETQRAVIRDYILPALLTNNLSTKVLVYDHNWDGSSYPDTVLSDAVIQTSSAVAGTAWHGYGGSPGVMLALAEEFPGKGNYQTEHSGGVWVGGDANQIVNDFKEIIHVMRSSGKAYVKWGLALDENRGPNAGGCDTCTPLVIVDTTTGNVRYAIDFYTLGHFSKFVLPGASRVYSANANGLVTAAFLNPDASKVLVAFNDSGSARTFEVRWGSKSFPCTLDGHAGATFTWGGTQSGSQPIQATNRLMASSFHRVRGLQTEATSDDLGGYNLGYADEGDYALFRNVNFSAEITNVLARVAGHGGGSIAVRLGHQAGPLIATLPIPDTGGWQAWETVTSPVAGTNGVFDLYLVFQGGTDVGNLNWLLFEGDSSPASLGLATRLIWSKQPDLATNGVPFVQQPVLQTADENNLPSTNGLPATLNVVVTHSGGAGALAGTTNVDIGTGGWNGTISFSDLMILSEGASNTLTARVALMTNVVMGNLLLNSDFNSPDSGQPPDDWTPWSWGTGWANHENNAPITFDGSYYLVAGAIDPDSGGGGFYQIAPGTEGVTYQLSVLSGADAWWLPYGEMRLFFLDAGNDQLGPAVVQPTVDPAAYGQDYDIAHPWEAYSITTTAPEGTAQIKVEFAEPRGTGSVWFENARLAEVLSVPVLASADTLPFTVHPDVPPPPPTNYIAGIAPNEDGTYTLQFLGSVDETYYLESTLNLKAPVEWEAVFGSTNQVTNSSGLWTHLVGGAVNQKFFRAVLLEP